MTSPSWVRVDRNHHCPVCDRPDWCLRAPDGSAAICARVDQGATRQVGEAGWLHRFRDRDGWQATATRRIIIPVVEPRTARADLADLAEGYRQAVHPGRLARLARDLGVTHESLARLGIGWCEASRAWTFPMTDVAGNALGIRLRTEMGRKFSVKGGHEGLFVPGDIPGAGGQLLVTEGPTDAAALLDLGFMAIGRPSCRGGVKLVLDLIRHRKPSVVVIVEDNDPGGWGQAGARELAARCRLHARDVRVIAPPPGAKDARAWVRSGATPEDLQALIESAPRHRVTVRTAPTERGCQSGY